QARELRLLGRHGAAWIQDLRAPVDFRRGMLEVWSYADLNAFGGGGRDLFARHPIREVSVGTQDANRWGDIAASSPHLARVETLRVTGTGEKIAFPDFLALLTCPHLTGLIALAASGCQYGDGGLF